MPAARTTPGPPSTCAWWSTSHINPLLEAAAEATEESIVNALVAAETMTGRDGITAHAIDHDRLVGIMRAHGRISPPP